MPLPRGLDAPSLMVDATEDKVDVLAGDGLIFIEDVMCLRPIVNAFGNLVLCALNAVTEANGANASIFVSRPCQHTHRVGVVQKECVRLCHIPDITANVQNGGNPSLAVHDSAGAKGVTYTLIDSVFEGNIDVCGECIQATLPDGANDVVRILEGFASVGCCGNGCGDAICQDVPLHELMHHREIVLIDVHQGKVCGSQLRDGQNIGDQATGKANRPSTYHRNFE